MEAYIAVSVKPLERNYVKGDYITVIENGKDFKLKLVENAEKGSKIIKAVPDSRN